MAINAVGQVCFCKNTRDNPDFQLGSLHERSLEAIWNDDRVRDLEARIHPRNCATFCKNMDINRAVEDRMRGSSVTVPADTPKHLNFL